MSFPEPRAATELLGQAAAEAALLEALRAQRLHHAWLLTGPPGVGKATLAYRFARRLLAGVPPEGAGLALPPEHPVFRRVAAGTHADLLTIARAWDEKRKRVRGEIVVDDVRRIGDFFHLTAVEGGRRVVIVDEAEEMNRNAANALLKFLEEPPPRALLMLVCNAPGRLLATLRSRCRRLALSRLPADDVAALLARHAPELSAPDRAQVAALAEGSPGRAARLIAEQGVTQAGMVDALLDALPDLPPGEAHGLADKLGADGFSGFMDMLTARLAARVRTQARTGGDGRFAGRPLEDWVDVWQALVRLQSDTEHFNMDKRQALIMGLGLLRGS